MKKILILWLFCLLTLSAAAIAAEKSEGIRSCKQCGMDRVTFAHSRMLIVYVDNSSTGTCSLNCAVNELKENRSKKVKALMVADYGTKELTDAGSATWVLGGKKPGVMTSLAKWAFARNEDAQRFVKENGGKATTFGEALDLALKENEQ